MPLRIQPERHGTQLTPRMRNLTGLDMMAGETVGVVTDSSLHAVAT